MFLDLPNPTELRQGDIVYGIYFPQMLCSSIVLLGRSNPLASPSEHPALVPTSIQKGKGTTLTAQVEVVVVHAMVLSQCCDLEVREGKKRPGIPYIALSPLLDIPYPIKTDPDKLQQLRNNSNLLIEAERSFINLFHILEQPPLPDEKMVDYNAIVSVPVSEYDYIWWTPLSRHDFGARS